MPDSRLSTWFTGLGHALGSFRKGYREGALSYHRARLISSMAQEAQWQGGTWVREASERRALLSSWIHTSIGLIARETSAAAQTFEVTKRQGREEIVLPNHPLEALLDNPNPWMGSNLFWQYTIWWLQLDGNAYWFVGVGEENRHTVYELWPLPSYRVEPDQLTPQDKSAFIKNYIFTANGIGYKIPAEYIVHFMLPNPFDIYRGMSPLTAAMLAVDSDLAMARWNGAFFGRNNVMPSAIINLSSGDPNIGINPEDRQALEEDLRAEYAAAERRTLVTTATKLDVSLLGWNPREMDFVEGRKIPKEEIFDVYGVPTGLLSENSTQANSDTADRLFKEKTIWPLLTLLGEQMSTELLVPFYGKHYRVKFKDIRPTDKAQEAQDINNAANYLSIDEMRERFWQLKPFAQPWSKVPSALATNFITPPALAAPEALPALPAPSNGNGHAPNGSVGQGDQAATPPAGTSEPPVVTGEELPPAPEPTTKDLRPYARDVRQWRTKALTHLKAGRSPQVKFVPASLIPEDALLQIRHGLAMAQEAADVRSAFEVEPWKAAVRPWSQFEQRIYELVRGALSNEAQRISAALAGGGPEVLDSEALWEEHRARLLRAMQPALEDLASYGTQQAQNALLSVHPDAVEINWSLVNQQARQWAQQYTYDLVRGITETGKQELQSKVSQWIAEGKPLTQLVQDLANITLTDEQGQLLHPFNPVRARLIAVTESTRMYAESNNRAFAEAGIPAAVMLPATNTHPGCRCYIQPYRLPSREWVIVWYTVGVTACEKELQTPLGALAGCKALHRKVVSAGDYSGLTLEQAMAQSQQKRQTA